MKRLIEFPLKETDQSVIVEIDEPETSGVFQAARADDMMAKAQITFEEAMDRVKPAASTIISKLRSLHDSPDEVEIQFGLKLSAECGAYVASAGIEVNYSVTLRWKKEEKKTSSA